MRTRSALTLTALFAVLVLPLSAQSVGYFGDEQAATGAAIGAAGYTAVDASPIGTFDFGTVDMFVHLNGDNGAANPGFTARSGDIMSWLTGGGRLMIYDRFVGAAEGVPEMSWVSFLTFTATRDFTDDADIDVLPTAGAFGAGLTNATLDGGNSSSHGFVSGLPGGAVPLLSRSNPSEVVAFYAPIGAGFLFYSTIPMDFYIDGGGDNGDAFRAYFPTSLDALAGLEAGSTVPEPATMTLLATGLAGMAAARRRRRQQS